jgi:putative ATP-dependent endonuclease of the OLD family
MPIRSAIRMLWTPSVSITMLQTPPNKETGNPPSHGSTTLTSSAPTIHYLGIERFPGIKTLAWNPAKGVNLIIGGGDVGKTTILDAIALLFSPINSTTLSDTDYFARNIDAGFTIEAVVSLPQSSGMNQQTKPSWPWHWNGREAVVPSIHDDATKSEPVYRVRVRGTEDLDLAYEIVQPDSTFDTFSSGLRRSIGLVRLSGDDRNDRDLRLVQGSALDRLLSDKSLRSRLAAELGKSDVKEEFTDEAKKILTSLDHAFQIKQLPRGLDLAITGGQGFSIAALIGLTANRQGVQLPLPSWGAGTRRIAALTIAEHNQGEAPITLVDEVERGLEPYRQRSLMGKLQESKSQVFVTTHSPTVITAASKAGLWYVDHTSKIGKLEQTKIEQHRRKDPETFLARIAIVAEGATEAGFVTFLLEKALGSSLELHGLHVTDGGGHETTLGLLESLSEGGLLFGGFADDEKGKHPVSWDRLAQKFDKLLFRWASGCLEENILRVLATAKLQELLEDPTGDKTGHRLRTLADRLGSDAKDFQTIKTKAGARLSTLILDAMLGADPEDPSLNKKAFNKHAQS